MGKINLSSPMKIFLVSFISMTLALAALGYATYRACYEILADDIGMRAQATAQVAANLVEVDPKLVRDMMVLDVLSARNHQAALEFKRKMAPLIKHNDVEYIYVEVKLQGNQIRYFVNPSEEEEFGEPSGTPMEYLYILTSEDESQYINRDRYDVGDSLRTRAYAEKIPMFGAPSHTKWGYLMTGYAPIFHNGHFIGLLGVDLSGDEFFAAAASVRTIIFVSFSIIVLLGGFFLYRASLVLSKPMFIDGLTKLFNHQYMKARLQEEISRAKRYGRPLSVLMLDLDFFKQINDCYGHQSGDIVLQRVSHLIQGTLREEDIACRYGGEEIAVILPETAMLEATGVAERLRRVIGSSEFSLESATSPVRVTVSIGIAELSGENTPDDLLEKADQALYLAKSRGRNRCDCCA